ncbi:hypothetical protein [Chloroflexus sp.]|uniref:hypothetical protein n=1 Tax=Chloroflexus sp. TaxID=1904827 RepID=UPI00298F1C81|nr:hypothetical protein [Chloroflexus sp.]MDW8403317.1 hypothetical protein [Chloroflexus sp.]
MNKRVIGAVFAGIIIVNLLACSAQPVATPPTPAAQATTTTVVPVTVSPPIAVTDEQVARQTLIEFFDRLHRGDYLAAAQLYGGSYEALLYDSSSSSSVNPPTLLWRACTLNGFVCRPIKRVVASEQIDDETFLFKVEFLNPDGSTFVRGPCCGATVQEHPPQSVFEYHVRKVDGTTFMVMDLPVYVP